MMCTMTQNSMKTECTGTQIGCEIRFTCPVCHADTTLIIKTPKDFYRRSRDVTCRHCKSRATVTTPGQVYKPAFLQT
jgi:hypothetical protein